MTGRLTLIWGTSLLLWTGDLAKAEGGVERLIQRAGENSLQPYKMVGVGFRGDLLVRRSDMAAGLGPLRESLKTLRAGRYELFAPCLECAMAEGLAALGQLDLARPSQPKQSPRSAATPARLHTHPTFGAVHGECPHDQAGDERAAERAFRVLARPGWTERALSWRLRSATSLAPAAVAATASCGGAGNPQKPMPDSSRGFDTTDLKTANDLLAELERAARPTAVLISRRRDRDKASSQPALQLFHAARLPAARQSRSSAMSRGLSGRNEARSCHP